MKIESVNNKYLAVTFKTIGFIVLLVVIAQLIFSLRFAQSDKKRQLKDLNSTLLSHQFNISEKLSIIASSKTFIDFIGSGELSRIDSALEMNLLFSRFRDDTIEGVAVISEEGENLFEYGRNSGLQTTLKLCYLNGFLNSSLGVCRHRIRLSFNLVKLVAHLKTMNPNIESCASCGSNFEVTKGRLGSFNSVFSGNMTLPIRLTPSNVITHLVVFEVFFLLILVLVFFLVHRSFKKISEDYIYSPIQGLVSALNTEEKIDLSHVSIFEIKFLGEALNNFISSSKDQEELRRNFSLGQMATQVAHDIRSPLEMLRGLKEEMAPLPEASRRKIQMGLNRIEEITFNLLKTNKQSGVNVKASQSEDLLGLIKAVITEKKIEYRNYEGLVIEESFDSNSYGVFSELSRSNLKSILSNLLNNSIDSFGGAPGVIRVELAPENGRNRLQIFDNGPGIPINVKENLFSKGFTTKPNGNGLGLFSAKQEIELLGGTISFESGPGFGTVFTITLPQSKAPITYVTSINAFKYEHIIILDDDPAFHEVWDKCLGTVGCKIEHIYSVEEMLTKYQSLGPKVLLLSDFELMDKQYDGIDTILKLNHCKHSVLVTARNEEQAIHGRCLKAGIKILPKSLVNFIKVVKETPEDLPSILLIDDDRLVHLNWSSYCKRNGVNFKGFNSINEFLTAAEAFDKNVSIYIDSNLGDGIKGEIESEKIFALGFLNLYLATGHDKDTINRPAWIKDIFSKSPDNIVYANSSNKADFK